MERGSIWMVLDLWLITLHLHNAILVVIFIFLIGVYCVEIRWVLSSCLLLIVRHLIDLLLVLPSLTCWHTTSELMRFVYIHWIVSLHVFFSQLYILLWCLYLVWSQRSQVLFLWNLVLQLIFTWLTLYRKKLTIDTIFCSFQCVSIFELVTHLVLSWIL